MSAQRAFLSPVMSQAMPYAPAEALLLILFCPLEMTLEQDELVA